MPIVMFFQMLCRLRPLNRSTRQKLFYYLLIRRPLNLKPLLKLLYLEKLPLYLDRFFLNHFEAFLRLTKALVHLVIFEHFRLTFPLKPLPFPPLKLVFLMMLKLPSIVLHRLPHRFPFLTLQPLPRQLDQKKRPYLTPKESHRPLHRLMPKLLIYLHERPRSKYLLHLKRINFPFHRRSLLMLINRQLFLFHLNQRPPLLTTYLKHP